MPSLYTLQALDLVDAFENSPHHGPLFFNAAGIGPFCRRPNQNDGACRASTMAQNTPAERRLADDRDDDGDGWRLDLENDGGDRHDGDRRLGDDHEDEHEDEHKDDHGENEAHGHDALSERFRGLHWAAPAVGRAAMTHAQRVHRPPPSPQHNSDTDGHDTDRAMMQVQQTIMDHMASMMGDVCQVAVFEGRAWKTADLVPGYARPPADRTVVHDIKIDANHPVTFGAPAGNFDYEGTLSAAILPARHSILVNRILRYRALVVACAARKPTGLYLAPGAAATVTIPQSAVASGLKIQIGAQERNTGSGHSKYKPIKRMDKIRSAQPLAVAF